MPCLDCALTIDDLFALFVCSLDKKKGPEEGRILPKTLSKIAVGMAHTTKRNFTDMFELGVPIDASGSESDRDVLFIYSKVGAMPTRMQGKKVQDTVEFLTVEEATENCHEMNVMFHYRGGARNQCLAIVPQVR